MAYSTFLLQPVGPKAGTPGTAAPSTPDAPPSASQSSQSPNTWMMLAPMLAVVVFMMFSNRSQRKRDAETRSSLKKGDRVVSQSGLIGELMEVEGAIARVKLAPGTNVQMLVSSISPFVPTAGPTASNDSTLKDLKDAKATGATAEKKG